MSLFDFVCLVKNDREKGIFIKDKYPADWNIESQEEYLISCSFPENMVKYSNASYSFNHENQIFYVYCFVHDGEDYSVIICSRIAITNAFYEFMECCKSEFVDLNPDVVFNKICILIYDWRLDGSNLILKMPGEDNIIVRECNLLRNSRYETFDPVELIGGEVNLFDVWHVLMKNKGILVVADDPLVVSSAVYSILSLAAPIRYCENFLVFTKFGDPRFAQIIDGSDEFKIVGTTNPLALERCEQFELIIKINGKKQSLSEVETNQSNLALIKKKMSSILGRIEDLLSYEMGKDPYFDFLDFQIKPDDFHMIEPKNPYSKQLSFDEILLFIQTKTFREWRKYVCSTELIRESFLSAIPDVVIKNKTIDQLKYVLPIIKTIRKNYKNDQYFSAVLKNHIDLIRKKINNKI